MAGSSNDPPKLNRKVFSEGGNISLKGEFIPSHNQYFEVARDKFVSQLLAETLVETAG